MANARTDNHGAVLYVQDDITGEPFEVTGDSATGAINVVAQITEAKDSSATPARVGDSATSVTILAANASRVKAIIVNDSTAILYLKYGATATTTDYTHKLYQDDTLEEVNYTGIIDGIWASDAGGAAQVTELA